MTGAKEQEGNESSGPRKAAEDQTSGRGFESGPQPQSSVPDTQLGNNLWGSVIPSGYLIAGRYRVERFIARGGMGEVYAAHDCVLTDRVALKTVTATASNDAEALAALRAEVTLSRKISHPNVCRMHDIGVHVSRDAPQLTFLTMEYIDGESLGARLLREGPIPEAEATRLLIGILAGLQAAHEAGVLHRDLKSDNVMLRSRPGTEPVPVIMDFGLASALSPNSSRVSSEQAMVGSLAYMAPEQVQGDALRVVTDIYSVGVIFFEMLTGQLPFKASSPALAALKRLHEPAPRVRSIDPRISPELDRILAKALQHRPQDRYPSARAMLQELLELLGKSELEVSELTMLGAVSSKPNTEPVDFTSDETTLVSGRPRPARRVSLPGDQPPASEDISLPVLAATTPPVGVPRPRRARWRVIAGAVATATILTAIVVWLPRPKPAADADVTVSIGGGNEAPIAMSGKPAPPGKSTTAAQLPTASASPPTASASPALGAGGVEVASRDELLRPEVKSAASQSVASGAGEVHARVAAASSVTAATSAMTMGAGRPNAGHPSHFPVTRAAFGSKGTTAPPRAASATAAATETPRAAPSTTNSTQSPRTNEALVYPPGIKRPSILPPSDAPGVQ